jgi:hypothetical protein
MERCPSWEVDNCPVSHIPRALFDSFTAVKFQVEVLWVGGPCCFHLQGETNLRFLWISNVHGCCYDTVISKIYWLKYKRSTFFSSPPRPNRLWGPLSVLYSG